MAAWIPDASRSLAERVLYAIDRAGPPLADRHAERMKDALESIVAGLENYEDRELAELLGIDGVLRIARRALSPDEWERVS